MAELFSFPEVEFDRREMRMFRTPLQALDEERIARFKEAFGAEGDLTDEGALLTVRGEKGILELFQASSSFWWSRAEETEEELFEEVEFPTEQGREMAEQFLRHRKLFDECTRFRSVGFSEVSRLDRETETPRTFRNAMHVNFGFELEELPVIGPGAKLQVTFGPDAEVRECFRFWREPVAEEPIRLLSFTEAADVLRRDRAFAALDPEESKVEFRNAVLGYYALPPRELQGYLIPAYAFEGTATTPQLERYDFVRHVAAVAMSPEEAKRKGLMIEPLPQAA